MTKVFALYIFIVCFLSNLAFANLAEFNVPHTYIASGGYSLIEARSAAIEEAQSDLLRQLGVLVESQQKMVRRDTDGISQEEFIEEAKTYTLGRVQTTIEPNTEKFALSSDGAMVFSATFRMVVDTADLFSHLNGILAQHQQARADSIAQVQQARADSIAQVERARADREALFERARADSLARAQRISEFQSAVQVARNSLAEEEQSERPLKIERDRLEQELKEAERQRNSAEIAFNSARGTDDGTDISAKRVDNERQLLQIARENYNRISPEFNIANDNWRNANGRVATARNNLRTAEDNLARATNTQSIPTQTQTTNNFTPQTSYFSPQVNHFSQRQEATTTQTHSRPPSQTITKNRSFVFSVRPELTINNTVMSGGSILEFGLITQDALYFSGEFNGGAELSNHLLYFGGLVNVGGAVNQNGVVKNVLGVSAGYRNVQNSFCFRIDGQVYDTTTGDNISFGGFFWKLMFGRNHNFDITNRFLLGTQNNPIDFDVKNERFIYERGYNTTYSLSIGYTLTKSRK